MPDVKRDNLIFGRYRLQQSLGKGSFGEVFYAEDTQFDPPRAVAFKLLHPQYTSDPQVREDLKREAGILARFDHPNILNVLDFGINEEIAFIVMELAQGGSLARRLRPDPTKPPVPMPLPEVATYLDQIADALDEAHDQGLIHRDIKPQNILLDRRGRILVADFGLATAVTGSSSSVMVDTTGSGTPLYMSPEQWQGRAGRASDIYALGAVVYQMVSGLPPFMGNQFELFGQHLNTPVPLLSERAPDLVYPPELDDIIRHSMAKDPRQRIRPAKELARMFKAAIGTGLSSNSQPNVGLNNVPRPGLISQNTADSLPHVPGGRPTPTPSPNNPSGTNTNYGTNASNYVPGSNSGYQNQNVAGTNYQPNPLPAQNFPPNNFKPANPPGQTPPRPYDARPNTGTNSPGSFQGNPAGTNSYGQYTGPNSQTQAVPFYQTPVQGPTQAPMQNPASNQAQSNPAYPVTGSQSNNPQSYGVSGGQSNNPGSFPVSGSQPRPTPTPVTPPAPVPAKPSKIAPATSDEKKKISPLVWIAALLFVILIGLGVFLLLMNMNKSDGPATNVAQVTTAPATTSGGIGAATTSVGTTAPATTSGSTVNTNASNTTAPVTTPPVATTAATTSGYATTAATTSAPGTTAVPTTLATNTSASVTTAAPPATPAPFGANFATVQAHNDIILQMAYSPDGKTLATASEDGTVKLWDTTSNQSKATLTGHTGPVRSLAFSPDGKLLVTGSADNTARVWDLSNNNLKYTLKGQSGTITSVAFNPDSKSLATGSDDKTVLLWDMDTGQQFGAKFTNPNNVTAIAYSADGKTLAVGLAISPSYQGKNIVLWDLASTKEKPAPVGPGHTGTIWSLAFSHNGKFLASGSLDKTTRLWNIDGDKVTLGFVYDDSTQGIRQVAFSPDDLYLASACDDGTIYLWNTKSGLEETSLKGNQKAVYSVAISPDGKTLASGAADGVVKLWSLVK